MKTLTRTIATFLVIAIAVPVTNTGGQFSSRVNAVVISPFSASYNTQINGGVVFAQNNSLSCDGTLAD